MPLGFSFNLMSSFSFLHVIKSSQNSDYSKAFVFNDYSRTPATRTLKENKKRGFQLSISI